MSHHIKTEKTQAELLLKNLIKKKKSLKKGNKN